MFSLQHVQSIAQERTKASNPTAYFLVRLFGEQDWRDHSFLIYAYFRWGDDIIDCPRTSYDEKKRCMERQGKLLRNLYDGLAYQGNYILEEQFAHYFVAFDREMGFALKDDILGILNRNCFTISHDDLQANAFARGARLVLVVAVMALERDAFCLKPVGEPGEKQKLFRSTESACCRRSVLGGAAEHQELVE